MSSNNQSEQGAQTNTNSTAGRPLNVNAQSSLPNLQENVNQGSQVGQGSLGNSQNLGHQGVQGSQISQGSQALPPLNTLQTNQNSQNSQNIQNPQVNQAHQNIDPQKLNNNQLAQNQLNQSQNQMTNQSAQSISVSGMSNLIDAVVKKGKLDSAKTEEMKKLVVTGNKTMEQALIEQGGVDEDQVYQIKAEMLNIEFIDLTQKDISQDILHKIPQEEARKNLAVPVEQGPNGVKVAMVDPMDLQKTKYLGAMVGGAIEPVLSSPRMINYVIDNQYGAQVGSEVQEALDDITDAGSSGTSEVVRDVTDLSSGGLANAPVSKIVNMILEYSIRYKSSDIHIEPRENRIAVRFRIYGVLSEKLTLPKKLLSAIVSRIKILADLKIDEHRIPQDGRFQVKLGKKVVDLRVSIVPAVYGEKVVMRLLEKGGGSMQIEDTGMRGYSLKAYKEALQKTEGIILVTGPTGSGKTQTLASSLKILNKEGVNIMTLENPVEIRIDGVNQVQINEEVGLTFAKGLRSFLRQDPDIIMVGEIRDTETAELAVQAALTGHLVLATLHTNSAAGAIPRLIDMGIEPFLLSSTMNIILAQRLVRRICADCKEAYYVDKEMVNEIHKVLDGINYDYYKLPNNEEGDPKVIDDDKVALYRGKKCSKCNDTGYTGRVGIFEALIVDEGISKLTVQKAAANEINKAAIAKGMVTMTQDGFMKALEGITSLEEILRVQSH